MDVLFLVNHSPKLLPNTHGPVLPLLEMGLDSRPFLFLSHITRKPLPVSKHVQTSVFAWSWYCIAWVSYAVLRVQPMLVSIELLQHSHCSGAFLFVHDLMKDLLTNWSISG